jgi:hypothetical protein
VNPSLDGNPGACRSHGRGIMSQGVCSGKARENYPAWLNAIERARIDTLRVAVATRVRIARCIATIGSRWRMRLSRGQKQCLSS